MTDMDTTSLPAPDQVVHGEPWWRSTVEPERHRWAVRCVRDGPGWAVNVLNVPPIVRDHGALARAVAAASAWIVAETVASGERKLAAIKRARGGEDQ